MSRPANEPGYKSKQERDLAAGVTAARDAQTKAKAAAKAAQEKKDTQNTLKGIQNQIENLTFEKQRQSGLRTYYQNLYNGAVLSGQSAQVIADYKKNYINADNNITKIDSNIKKKQDEYAKVAKGFKTANESYTQDGRERVQKALAKTKKSKTKPNGTKNTETPGDKQPPKTIRCNAPMVKSAYFRANTPPTNSLVARGAIPKSAASLIETLSTFGDGDTNRGFIVPNKRAQQAALKELDPKDKALVGIQVPYGFRFHYNPQFIQQSYGSITGISPELIESGKDKTNMITTPASSSSISCTLYLNRIEDMNALANYAVEQPSNKAPINTDEKSLEYYPEIVSASERKLIKDFGTMYDLDFLFKTINGEMGGYKSPLRGIKTGDVGWLNGIAVEVHLGRKLRYLARITNISVNHIQFTENMVPTLTTVVLTMARFHDAMVTD